MERRAGGAVPNQDGLGGVGLMTGVGGANVPEPEGDRDDGAERGGSAR